MNINEKDLEAIEKIVYKSADDIAVSTSMCFERLQEYCENMETRITNRLRELENAIVIREKVEPAEVKCTCQCGNEHMTAK